MNGLPDSVCHLDGAWVPAAEARVSAFDRGFLYGDSVFETLRTYGDDVFLPDRHVERLLASAKRIALRLPWTGDQLTRLLRETWRRNREARARWRERGLPGDGVLRLTVSRGAGPMRLAPGGTEPTLAVLVQPLAPLEPRAYEHGVDCVVARRRRSPPDVLDPAAKTGSLLPLLLAREEAVERGAHEALLLNVRGRVVEGTTSNLFLVRRGALVTPPLDEGLLPGVTREVVLDAARRGDLEVREDPVTRAALGKAEEAFLTSTTHEIVPVRRIGGKRVGSGAPGPVTLRVTGLFHARVRKLLGRAKEAAP